MWLRRLLVIPAIAALAASATLLGTAGTAGASTVATTAVVAQQHRDQADHGTAAAVADESELVFGGYYDNYLECSMAGEGSIGLVLSGGVVYDWECFFDGEPGPLGPWELVLFVEPASCPSGQTAGRVGPNRIIC